LWDLFRLQSLLSAARSVYVFPPWRNLALASSPSLVRAQNPFSPLHSPPYARGWILSFSFMDMDSSGDNFLRRRSAVPDGSAQAPLCLLPQPRSPLPFWGWTWVFVSLPFYLVDLPLFSLVADGPGLSPSGHAFFFPCLRSFLGLA